MSRNVHNYECVFRAVIVPKKTKINPEYVAPEYVPEYKPGNNKPAFLYLDEPADFEVYRGPYFRVGDATAALNRYGAFDPPKSDKLAEHVYSVRIEQSDNKWFTISE